MRRFLLLSLLAAGLATVSCDDGDNWTPRHQINHVQSLVNDHPATAEEFRTFISDIEQGLWDLDNWITYRNGDVWNTSYSGFINTAFGKGSQFLDLIFYADGTCRQCYLYAPAPYNNIPYPFLYTTLLWSFNGEDMTITLTNTEYLAQDSPYAKTTLRLLYYRYGEFIMDGLQPSPEALNGYKIRYIGTIDNATIRLDYENRYKDESIFASLNGNSYR
jgi:hypothetical protein